MLGTARVSGERYRRALLEILERIGEAANGKRGLAREHVNRIKLEVARKYSLDRVPANTELIELARDPLIRRSLLVRPSRISSGIAIVTVAAKPYPCPPKAHCIYCPGGVKHGTPQSYIKESPSVMHGSKAGYDPRKQVMNTLRAYVAKGYPTSKIEVVIVGGTFLYYPRGYQEKFVKGIFDGLNGFVSTTLEEAHLANEGAKHRCVGLAIETRPDYCLEEHVDLMLRYGATRAEIGVQILDDQVLRKTGRGHGVREVVDAIRVAKDAGLKVGVHMMPCLPGSTSKKDLDSFRRLFYDDRFKPDMLKIYPTLVLKTAPLYKMYLKGLYKPCSLEELVELIVEVKRMVPPWLRIMRVQREIPPEAIVAGPNVGSLRNLVHEELRKRGLRCRCIRCREIARSAVSPDKLGELRLTKRVYSASEGLEYFLSYEDSEGRIAGFLRLRKPSRHAHRPEIRERPSAIVRELRVYGLSVDVGERYEEAWQHRGLGRRLMVEAERIAFEDMDAEKLVVISAVGTREYYRKLGYGRDGPYVSKILTKRSYSKL